MKVNVEVDMTPAELREAMGLPDVKSVQDRWMGKLEEALNDEIAKLSPEVIAQKWTNALVPNTDLLNMIMKMVPGSDSKK